MVIYSPEGTPIISVVVDDSSYLYEEIMGDSNVVLEFSLTDHVELVPGSYIMFRDKKYELLNRTDVSINHTRNYQYKATFSGPQARFSRYILFNYQDGRVNFEMIATPDVLLQMVLWNLNDREPNTWTLGSYAVKEPRLVSFNHNTVKDALNIIAETFDTEWGVEPYGAGYRINLRKNEFNKESPLALGYGKNQGFKPGVGRVNYGEFGQVEKVWIEGSDRNISLEHYDWSTLHFPRSFAFKLDANGKFFFWVGPVWYQEDGYDSSTAVDFVTDEFGSSVRLATAGSNCMEASLDLTEYYPKRVGQVTDVRYLYKGQYLQYHELSQLEDVEWNEVQVDIVDSTIGDESGSLDYDACQFSNDEPLTVIFQTGMLAGREFNATFIKAPMMAPVLDPETGHVVVDPQTGEPVMTIARPGNRFELSRATIDGVDMPNAQFRPNAVMESGAVVQDTYIVVNCWLPSEYIRDDETFSGAELEALREAGKFILANKDPQFTFKGQVDDLFAHRNWNAIRDKLIVGGCISFQNSSIQPEPVVTRIIGIKTFVNNQFSPELTLSNETVKGGVSAKLAKLSAEDEHIVEGVKQARRYSQRSFRDAKETIAMLAGTIDYFTEGINPITVETMSLLVGYEALQFKFYADRSCNPPEVTPYHYDADARIFYLDACVIQHLTHGITAITSAKNPNGTPVRNYYDYLRWSMAQVEFGQSYFIGTDASGKSLADTAYYLYAKVDASNVAKLDTSMTTEELTHIYGEFVLTTEKKPIKEKLTAVDGYYYLLVGILNSEYEGGRSFAPLYGFTEVLPGQITTDVIRSASGASYFDLVNNQFALGDSLTFLNNELVLNGAFVQSGNRKYHLGAFRGQWVENEWYYPGDEVWWQAPNGAISSYIYINESPSLSSSSNNPTNTAYWQVFAQGIAGSSGDSSLSVDLTNEVDGLAVGSDAVLSVSVDLLTTISAYLGTDATNITGIKASVPSGFSSDIDVKRLNGSSWTSIKSNSYITVNASSIDLKVVIDADTDFTGVNSVPITIEVQCGTNGERELTFTILPVCEGEDGAVYKLVTDYDVVKGTRSGSSINYSPTVVHCTRMLGKGDDYSEVGSSSPYYGYLKYSTNGGSTKQNYTSSGVTASNAASSGKIIFYWYADSAGTILLDQETVPIVVDGETGNGIDDIEEYYAFSSSGNTAPTTWPYGPDLPAGTRPSQSDLLSHTGEYLWTKTVIKYTDTSKPDVVKVFAQYLPNNGTNGVNGPMLVGRGQYDCDESGQQSSGHQVYYGDDKIRNVVWYDNGTTARWYMTLDVRSVPAQNGSNSFSNIPPSNTNYWAPFDGSFANVATGLLFARRAYIENAVVRFLETADVGSARIVAETNNLCMYDGVSNDPKLLITGDDLSGINNSFDVNFFGSGVSTVGTGTRYDSYPLGQYSGESSGVSFTTENGATLLIPAMSFFCEGGYNGSYSGNNTGAVLIRFGFKVDGREVDDYSVQGVIGRQGNSVSGYWGQTVQTSPVTVALGASPNPHTVKVFAEITIFGLSDMASEPWHGAVSVTTGSPKLHIYYSDQKTEIGANGFQVVFGSDRMLKCFISGSTATFVLRCNDVGLELSSSGNSGGTMRIMIGGTWYYAKRTYDNNAQKYFLELSLSQ